MTKKKSNEAPQLGIFWLVRDELVIDSVPLSQAEPYGDSQTHPRSHIDTWTQYQRIGKVPPESEYEEYPRGRVMHHPKSGEFRILADKCILGRKDLITQIRSALNLPASTKIGTDSQYRCFFCLYGSDVDDEDL